MGNISNINPQSDADSFQEDVRNFVYSLFDYLIQSSSLEDWRVADIANSLAERGCFPSDVQIDRYLRMPNKNSFIVLRVMSEYKGFMPKVEPDFLRRLDDCYRAMSQDNDLAQMTMEIKNLYLGEAKKDVPQAVSFVRNGIHLDLLKRRKEETDPLSFFALCGLTS